jgi:signal peptidase I
MFSSYEHYSTGYGARVVRGLLVPLLRGLVLACILYLVISGMFLSAFRVDSGSMQPLLQPRDRVLVSPLPFGPHILFFSARLPAYREPQRGDVVVVRSPQYLRPSFPLSVLEPVVRFFSGQSATVVRDSTGARVPPYMIKRVVGLPGDTVRMSGFRLSVMIPGSAAFVEELRLVDQPYAIATQGGLPAGWQSQFPFSGEAPPRVLRDGEYFLLGDNRPDSSDSRSWGPLQRDQIVGKVLLRYWPLPRSGRI